MSWTPEQVNRLEVWEVGAALGSATDEVEEWHANRPTDAGSGVESSGRDFVAERMAAHREGGPAPDVDPMTPRQMQMLTERLRVG